MSEWQMVALNILIVTPVLFVFCETLPKDLFGGHSDRLMYPLAPVLEWSRRLFTITLLVPLTGALTRVIFRMRGERRGTAAFHPRRQVELLVKEGVGHGLISDEQEAIVERALSIGERTIGDEMIKWPQVRTLELNDAPAAVWALAEKTGRARFPVVDNRDRVTGIVHVMDALLRGRADCPPICELQQPALTMDAATSLRQGLRRLQQSHGAMAVVTRNDQPVGIVTIKDLVEPITGELRQW
jgi:CBS domain containing-hemolysin-like protein